MAKVITFSRTFPSYHPRKGEPTYFVEQLQNSLCSQNLPIYGGNENCPMWFLQSLTKGNVGYKHHTIRGGHRFKVGDWFSPRVWGNDVNPKSGRSGPYHSKQIIIAPVIQVKKTWDFHVDGNGIMSMAKPGQQLKYIDDDFDKTLARNDGLDHMDFIDWICMPYYRRTEDSGPMQIICWNENINY